MTRPIMLGLLVTMLAGCRTDYTREIRAAEPLSNHRFVRVEFEQAGHRPSMLFQTIEWYPVSGFVLVADDGWRLVVQGPSPNTGYSLSADPKRGGDPVLFTPGAADRLTLIDPKGWRHPVIVAVGELSPRPPHVTGIRQVPTASQPKPPSTE